MEKEKLLEVLQDKARELSALEVWLQGNNQKRLAEFVSVRRLVNFKVQKLVESVPQDNVKRALYCLDADLLSSLEYSLERQLTTLQDLYGVALDYLHNLRGLFV